MRNPNLLCRCYAQQLQDEQKVLEKLLAEKRAAKGNWRWQSYLDSTERMIKRLKEDIAKGEENPYYLYFVKGEEKTE